MENPIVTNMREFLAVAHDHEVVKRYELYLSLESKGIVDEVCIEMMATELYERKVLV